MVRPLSLRRSALASCALGVVLATAACTADGEPTTSPTKSSGDGQSTGATGKPRQVTFGAYGSEEEVAAFQEVVDSFNASSTTRKRAGGDPLDTDKLLK